MRPTPLRRSKQRGFALVEVMAAMVLTAIFVMGISGLWALSSSQTRELVLRQKAAFRLNGEMERLSSFYNLTTFNDPASCSGLLGTGLLCGPSVSAASAGIYPSGGVGSLMPNGSSDNFVTTSASTFAPSAASTSADFLVYYVNYNGADRNFVWIDRGRRLMAQISWTTVNVPQKGPGPKGRCEAWDLSGDALCQMLTLTLQYPYRLETTNTITALPNPKTLTLMTIVGRRR